MTLSLLPTPSAWGTLSCLPQLLSTHTGAPPPHDLQLLATLQGRPCAAFLIQSTPDALRCVASASLDLPERPLLFCALIPYARSVAAPSLSLTVPLRPPARARALTPLAYAQQLPFDPGLFTPTLLALTRSGATPSLDWEPLHDGLILARLSVDTSP